MSDAVLFTTLGFVALALWAVLLALGAGILEQSQERRLRPAVDRARQATVAAVSSASMAPAARAVSSERPVEETGDDRTNSELTEEAALALAELPAKAAVGVLLDLAHSLGGSSRSILADIADEVGLLDRARLDLDGRWWWQRRPATLTTDRPKNSNGAPSRDDARLLATRRPRPVRPDRHR